jgi:predicted TIM-barrel fold metal-dependent hydrolase
LEIFEGNSLMRANAPHLTSAEVRKFVGHPIIDGDGHVLEYMPTLLEYMAEEGGQRVIDRFKDPTPHKWYSLTDDERRARREVRPGFWNWPSQNVLDYATATFPQLLEERREELGLDFLVIYPSVGIQLPHAAEEEDRRPACRALNRYMAELFGPYSATMCPVGVVPMHTPDEALEELEFGLGLGLRAFAFPGNVRRQFGRQTNRDRPSGAFWIDTYGIDSEYDYDPVWQRCLELGVVPAFHSGSVSWTNRRSISKYVYNHMGHFAAANDAIAKSLLLGGVTRRFPGLRFAFLEGGVGWAAMLLGAVKEHWEKRNGDHIWAYDPERFEIDKYAELFDTYAPELLRRNRDGLRGDHGRLHSGIGLETPESANEFKELGITSKAELIQRFVQPFYFGCEADDSINAWAFQKKFSPLGTSLNAFFSSDTGHWDVPDANEVVVEAYELVEKELLNLEQFRRFTYENIATMYTDVNPKFFNRTTVEAPVTSLITYRQTGSGTDHAC